MSTATNDGSIVSGFVDYVSDPNTWTGATGLLARIAEHAGYTVSALAVAALIALPVGLLIGHTNRGSFLALNIANAARALPSTGLLIFMALAIAIGVLPAVAALVVLDGVTVLPNAKRAPAHERIAKWAGQLDTLEAREPRRYRTTEEAAAQMRAHNGRLPHELVQHLATFGVRRNQDGTYSWKFDNYVRVNVPYDMSYPEIEKLWTQISCPTLLVYGKESWASDPQRDGQLGWFKDARSVGFDGAGHWVHHDRLDAFVAEVRGFLKD